MGMLRIKAGHRNPIRDNRLGCDSLSFSKKKAVDGVQPLVFSLFGIFFNILMVREARAGKRKYKHSRATACFF
jgi:hypothetical protein